MEAGVSSRVATLQEWVNTEVAGNVATLTEMIVETRAQVCDFECSCSRLCTKKSRILFFASSLN